MGKIKVTRTKGKYRRSKTTKVGSKRRCNTCGRFM